MSRSSPDTCRPRLAADGELEQTLQGLSLQWSQAGAEGAMTAERAEELRALVGEVQESLGTDGMPVKLK